MDETRHNRKTAYRLLIIEAVIIISICLLIYAFFAQQHAYSVVLGGLAFILPNALFVRLSLGKSAAESNYFLARFYLGEATKIVSTIIIFAISIYLISPLNIGLMFVAYGLTLMVNLTGLAITMGKQTES